MPEPFRNEEDENRKQSLCLFNVAGITELNRCSNCPGAARSALQHRRCPLDVSQPNIFHPLDPESKIKSSASSSGKVPETDLLLVETSRLSLADPFQGVGSKRKLEDVRLDNHQKRILSREFQHQSPQDWLMTKPQKPFEDSIDVNPNRMVRQMMRNAGVQENHSVGRASSSTVTARSPAFSIDLHVPGVWCDDMEIEFP